MTRNHFLRFRQDESGGFAVITAISAPILIGAAALGAEVGYGYMKHNDLQSAAQIAAISAANAVKYDSTDGTAEAYAVAAAMGKVNSVDGMTVTVNSPPASGAYKGVAGDIEVIIQKQQQPLLEALFHDTTYNIIGRSVARAGTKATTGGTGNGCVVALASGDVTGLTVTGTGTVNISGCDVYVDASWTKNNKGAVDVSSNKASLTVENLNVVGTVNGNGVNGNVNTGVKPLGDPYADVPFPSKTGCDYSWGSIPSTVKAVGPVTTICGGMSVTNAATSVVFDTSALGPDGGVFLFQDTWGLTVQGGSVTSIGGVTLAFANGGYPKFTGGTVSITAPTSGTYAGLAIMADRNNTSTFTLNGGSQQTITGAIYIPAGTVQYAGNSSTTGSGGCTQIVANLVNFTGTSQVGSKCDGVGVRAIGDSATSTTTETASALLE